MKALITGATGFIGSHLTEALLKRGYAVKCLIRKTSDTKWIESQAVELCYGDCVDFDSLKKAVSNCDYVFHLAGLTKACREEDYFCVNVKGTENIVKAIVASNRNLKRFILLSSQAASGPSYDGSPVTEETPPRPVSHYGRSKLAAEQIVLNEMEGIPFTIIRPPAVYGPRDRDFYMFFKLIKRGIFPYWGKAKYSMVYIDDLINGIILSAESEKAIGKSYFLTDGKEHTNEEIAFCIAKTFNKNLTKVRIPWAIMPFLASLGERFSKGKSIFNRDKVRELSYNCWLCDCSKAVRELGYEPRVELQEGIKWTADWYRINRWL